MSSLIFILGQTGTGKTSLATKLAKEKNGELVNCDSRQIYTHLDIVTGKTDNPKDIPTHMIDIVTPESSYSAYEYAVCARKRVEDILRRGKTAIVVGGTGMYAHMLLHIDPSEPHQGLSEYGLQSNLNLLSKEELQKELQKLNPKTFDGLNGSDRENPRRLMGKIKSLQEGFTQPIVSDSPHSLLAIYHPEIHVLLHKDTDSLESRITDRVDARIKEGAIEECEDLLMRGYSASSPGLATIGYKSILRYIKKEINYETMRTEWITRERQYAKRQKTYLLKYFPEAQIVCV